MTQDFTLANASLVLESEIVTGSITVHNGNITAMDQGRMVPNGAEDCFGDFVAPGLIELHTDNLERHLTPRPHVHWPHQAAIVAHDAELASTGITTVFDALRVGSITTSGSRNYPRYARALASEILSMRSSGALKISHHLHLRAEICSESLTEELAEFEPDDRVGIVSLMDHTPGQRQFGDVSKFEAYLKGKYGMSKEEFGSYVGFLCDLQARLGAEHETAAVAEARRLGATLASHDDTTEDQVGVSHDHGVTVAEFPTTAAAARACRARGIDVIMGAPNLVRGGSHSGNVSAIELARDGLLNILSSDYVPSALLLAAVQLGDIWDDMPRGIATVSSTPAKAVGLDDRGVLKLGRRADLIRFSMREGVPALRAVWSGGRRVS